MQGVVNRDIKLENTLLDASPKPLVKITDFGYCKSDKESLPKSKVGTPGYTGACQLIYTTIHTKAWHRSRLLHTICTCLRGCCGKSSCGQLEDLTWLVLW